MEIDLKIGKLFNQEYMPGWSLSTSAIVGGCDICGKEAYNQYWLNGELKATRCFKHPYDFYKTTFTLTSVYNYRCHGEFNTPAIPLFPTGTYFPKSCPFCGREMKGL